MIVGNSWHALFVFLLFFNFICVFCFVLFFVCDNTQKLIFVTKTTQFPTESLILISERYVFALSSCYIKWNELNSWYFFVGCSFVVSIKMSHIFFFWKSSQKKDILIQIRIVNLVCRSKSTIPSFEMNILTFTFTRNWNGKLKISFFCGL